MAGRRFLFIEQPQPQPRSEVSGEQRPSRPCKRAAVLRSLVIAIVGGSLLIGAAAVFNPTSLLAFTPRAFVPRTFKPQTGPLHSPTKMHDDFARTLARVTGQSHEVLAIHGPGASKYGGVVIWRQDEVNPGIVDPQEIAVISFSPLFRTITVYSMAEGVARAKSSKDLKYDRASLAEPGFCDRWCVLPWVRPHVVGSEISDMSVERLVGSDGELSLLRLSLEWGADSTDGAGEASALIQLRSQNRTGSKE